MLWCQVWSEVQRRLIFQPAELSAVWDVVCGYSLTVRGPLLILLAKSSSLLMFTRFTTNMWHLYCSNAALCESPSKPLVKHLGTMKTYEEYVQYGSRARLGFRRPQLSYLRWQLSFSVFWNRVWLLWWSRSARGLRGPTRPQFPRCLVELCRLSLLQTTGHSPGIRAPPILWECSRRHRRTAPWLLANMRSPPSSLEPEVTAIHRIPLALDPAQEKCDSGKIIWWHFPFQDYGLQGYRTCRTESPLLCRSWKPDWLMDPLGSQGQRTLE